MNFCKRLRWHRCLPNPFLSGYGTVQPQLSPPTNMS